MSSSEINLSLDQNLFIRKAVPSKGIVCSNMDRAQRVAQEYLKDTTTFRCSWGAQVWIGTYYCDKTIHTNNSDSNNNKSNNNNDGDDDDVKDNEQVFVAVAPVGSGSGLVFTELFSAGAEYLVRYGSDDVKYPESYEYTCVKLVDETDNLYGFNQASGVPEQEWGQSVFCSPVLLQAFQDEASERNLRVERRICHHLENYHSLRNPNTYPNRKELLQEHLKLLHEKSSNSNSQGGEKKESFDMESAVLFRVAKDFNKHALSVLQTVNKENPGKCDPYEGKNREHSLKSEQELFVDYIFKSLLRVRNAK